MRPARALTRPSTRYLHERKREADGLGAQGAGFAGAVASGDAEDLGGLICDEGSLAWVQVGQQALQEVGGVQVCLRAAGGHQHAAGMIQPLQGHDTS